MIGDTWRDAELARNVGIKFIKIDTNDDMSSEFITVKTLMGAANIILESVELS